MSEQLNETLNKRAKELEEISCRAVAKAVQMGAHQCKVTVSEHSGIDVSSRNFDIENVEFQKNSGLVITVYKDQHKGSAYTSDISDKAITDCIDAALSIASYTDQDPYAGLAEKEDLCWKKEDLSLVGNIVDSADDAISKVIELENKVKNLKVDNGLQIVSDGAALNSSTDIRVIANSYDFVISETSSSNWTSLTLMGTGHDGKKQRASGYLTNIDFNKVLDFDGIVKEAIERTVEKLDARKINTNKYPIVFTQKTAASIVGSLLQAIKGSAIYNKSSFLLDKINTQVLPSFINLVENPFIDGKDYSSNFDGEGCKPKVLEIIKDGVLKEYLLSSYSARRLKMPNNAHASASYGKSFYGDEAHTLPFKKLLSTVGEGLVIDSLMGQGVDITSGNYSRGASGYYFKNGNREFAIDEITIASNLKDMLLNIALLSNEYDERMSMQIPHILIDNLSVSGN